MIVNFAFSIIHDLMKNIALIFLSIVINGSLAIAQQKEEWLKKLEEPASANDKLKAENKVDQYKAFDFSTLMVPKSEFLGILDDHFRRIDVYYSSVVKSESDPLVYKVTGASVVYNNKCDFTGTITIKQIREFENLHYGIDEKYKGKIKSEGILIGEYIFKEDPKQFHVGTFNGVVTLWWYLDKFGIMHYDDIQKYSDTFKNNQYVGTWTQYDKTGSKICNWGEYRIPFSGDLDIGAGEFTPDPKYKKMGW
jgi:hypothetical protein